MHNVGIDADRIAVIRKVIELGKAKSRVGLTRYLNIHLSSYEIDCRRTLRGGSGTRRWKNIAAEIREISIEDAVQAWEVTSDDFDIAEIKKLVGQDRAANAASELMPPLRSVDAVRKAVCGIQGSIAEEPVSRSVDRVAAASSDGIHDTASCASELCREAIRQNLKLLHGVL